LKRKLAALKSSKANALLEREIAALEGATADHDDKDAEDKNNPVANGTRSNKHKPGDDAGSQFGRQAYNNKH
jgi:hypothetical protein